MYGVEAVTIDQMLDETASWYGLTTKELTNADLRLGIPARRTAALILRYHFQVSIRSIGYILGYDDVRRTERTRYHLIERANDAEWNAANLIMRACGA